MLTSLFAAVLCAAAGMLPGVDEQCRDQCNPSYTYKWDKQLKNKESKQGNTPQSLPSKPNGYNGEQKCKV